MKMLKGIRGFTPLEIKPKEKDLTLTKISQTNSTSKVLPGFYRNAKRHFLSLTGFTLTELLVVTSILGAISPAAYIGVKNKAYEIQCVNNLKQIGMAIQMFEIDEGKFPDAKFFPEDPNINSRSIKVILKSYGMTGKVFICPTAPQQLKDLGLTYLWNDEVNGKSLYFIKNSSRTWLMTDITAAYEKVKSHRNGYNILYADFHVGWSSSPPFKLESVEEKND